MTAMWYSLPVLTCLTLQPCPSKPDRSSLTPTVNSDAQPLVSHLHHVLSSPITCLLPPPGSFEPDRLSLTPHCVSSSATVCVPPPPCHLEHNHSSPIQPCPFECNRSSPAFIGPFRAWLPLSHPTMSTRAQLLVSHPPPGPFEPDCSSLTQLCLFERNRSSPASARPGCFSPTQLCQLEHNCLCPILH